MRNFTRGPEPEILQLHGERWNRQWVELRTGNPAAGFSWYTVDGMTARDHILPALRAQTQRHCSFCDAFPVEGVSIESIEHFRPKSKSPELAYSWINLYYCCDACQSAKREKWDDRLLTPDAPGYLCSAYFEFDYTTGEIKPNALCSDQDQQRAATTIELYGLNLSSRRRNRQSEARKFARQNSPVVDPDEWPYRDYLGLSPA